MIKQTKASVRVLSGQDAFFIFTNIISTAKWGKESKELKKRRLENGNEIFKRK
jgi:hypothetical protein